MLGLALEERAIVAAEICKTGKSVKLCRTAEFAYPEGLSLDDPQPLGQAFADFLKRRGFSAQTVIAGVPARWLLARQKQFPPAPEAALANMARLEAERTFATDLDHLLVDFAACSDVDTGAQVLLAALKRDRAERIRAMLQAAGLKLKALTATSVVLAAALQPVETPFMLLSLRPGHVEIGVCEDGRLRAIRHLPVALPANGNTLPGWKQPLMNEMIRHAAALQQDSAGGIKSLVVWNGAGLDAEDLLELGEPMSIPTLLIQGMRELRLERSNGGASDSAVSAANGSQFMAAAALAAAGAGQKRLPLDFIHSRLAVRPKSMVRRRLALVGAACIVVLAAAALLVADLHAEQRDVELLRQRLDQMKPEIEAARDLVQRANTVHGWTDGRPRFLEPLRELALAFPVEQRIWVMAVNIRQDMRAMISGRSASERAVLDLLDRIRSSPSFANVKLLEMRDAGGNTNETSFGIGFDFIQKE